ncbi:MAG: cardiolipin synthase [Paludibacteraceae bacterium]|nr:cardiolipin synthase [Paludibacteraceae bacterium]
MIWEIAYIIIYAVYVYTICVTIFFMLVENRNPVKSIAWILVLVFLPILGFLFYILVGRKFRKRHMISKRSLLINKKSNTIDLTELPSLELTDEQRSIATLAFRNSDAMLHENNAVTIFTKATDLYDNIIADLKGAKHHIHMEYYIFLADKIGQRIMDVLKEKAQEGVIVRVIIDDVGSWQLKKKKILELQEAGIEIKSFLEVGLPYINSRVNYRNHRKIIVVDGLIGYTGGFNIADRYVEGLSWGCWRDTHIRLEGSAVLGLQKNFLTDWFFVKRELIQDALYYPAQEKKGNCLTQIVISGPDMVWESIMQIFAKAFMEAKKRIYVESPYFLPPESLITALQTAALSGIDVRLILPKKSDAKITLYSTFSYIDQMLKAGIKVYMYDPGFIHSKIVITDDISFIGSANMDFRSFEQNFELNAIMYDTEVAQQMTDIFMDDVNHSVEITKETWTTRSLTQKVKESFSRLLSPLL